MFTPVRDVLQKKFIGASTFGGIIELLQPNFNRSSDVNDWIADTLGVLLGIGCGLIYKLLRED